MAHSPAIPWILGGAGALLVYGAVHRSSPLTVIAGVIGGQSGPPPETGTFQSVIVNPSLAGVSATGQVGQAIAWARAQIGKPYSNTPDGITSFDCSLLMQKAYAAAGITIPRNTFNQVKAGIAVDPNNIQPGDLIFERGMLNGQMVDFGHVVMYIGGGQVIQAQRTGTNVMITPVPTSGIQAVRRYIGVV